MSRISLLLLRLSGLAALAFTLTAPAIAQHHDFTGNYKLANVTEQGSKVEVTISLVLHNSSGKDLQGAGVVLYPSNAGINPTAKPVGAFDLIESLPRDHEVSIHQRFTLPAGEYERWKYGQAPLLVLLRPDSHGDAQPTSIDLHQAMRFGADSKDGIEGGTR